MTTSATIAPHEVLHGPAQARLAAFAAAGSVDEATLSRAVPVVLDSLAVTIAGGREPGVSALMRSLEPTGAGLPSFWSRDRYRADDAALLFGMASHVLDYDDVSTLQMGHPSVPILSALLAATPRDRVGGRRFLEAFVVGTEVSIRLAQAMGFRHYALGFHATCTLGTVGAAAACARMLELDATRTANALAIAASLSSGLQVNFGSMVKSLHVGIAASNGLKAARLAGAGIVGAAEAFEGEGFLRAFSGGETEVWPSHIELGRPFAIADPGFEQKRYPCCYLLHKMIEATLLLGREAKLGLDDVASARVDLSAGAGKALIHPYPKNGLNALFSGPYAVMASLADGRIDFDSFTDQAVMRPHIQARLRDVTVAESGAPSRQAADVGAAPVTVTLTPRSGAAVSRTVTVPPGSQRDPITPAQLLAKWTSCLRRAKPGIGEEAAAALFHEGAEIASMQRMDGWLDRIAVEVRS